MSWSNVPKITTTKKVTSLSKSKFFNTVEKENVDLKDMDIDDDDEGVWQQMADFADKVKQDDIKQEVDDFVDTIRQKDIKQKDDMKEEQAVDMLEVETPRFESLSVSERPNLKRKRVGEDVFTRECVKTWQSSRIKAWESRYLSPEAFYYRFVAPGEGQQNGGWSAKEHKMFMDRYNEWIEKGYKIGASWGLFSCAIPHRVGYQCMNYYRKLISDGKVKDESYAVVDGKIKQIHKERAPPGIVPTTELGPEWKDEEVKETEKNVDQWLKEFHGRSGNVATSRPLAAPKQKAAPRVIKSTTRRSNIGDMVKKMPPRGPDDDFMNEADPEIAHLQQRDWETEWRERLTMYKKFLEPYLDKATRYKYWQNKQEWRRGLITTEMLLQKNSVQKSQLPPTTAEAPVSTPRIQQSSLSRFFTGVKKLKVDTPDEYISFVRIPNDLYSGVKQIKPFLSQIEARPSKTMYYQVDDMNDSASMLDDILSNTPETRMSPLEGILVDPPWEFYVADGKNDGKCTWNLSQFENLMAKVVRHMSAGMVFVWTHKMIQADVVRVMYNIDCKYVENLVWFKKSVNNVCLDEPSPYISSTKEILLMFKKGDGFELRHQRSADVIIDFEKPVSDWIEEEYTEPKPPGVYDMIETLLPKAGYDESLQRGRFVELWAKKKSSRREGWIAFHENKSKSIPIDAVEEMVTEE